MSIVFISDGSGSDINGEDPKGLASRIHVESLDDRDTQDYLTLITSFESVLRSVEGAPDYLPPDLVPQKTKECRKLWKARPADNPFNAWSHKCHIVSASPTNNLLAGRTLAVKDNICVGGLPTTLGAPQSLFPQAEGYPVSSIDSVVVSRILAAGGMIKGTSTCESFCASPLSFTSATGPVHNPLLHGYTAGGSSSGSAALVAAHQLASSRSGAWGETVELAIGTDQAGSVRIPASYNGLYGLKPTFGLVPYTGAGSMSPMIDHIGPLAARLEDVAVLLEVMAGYDGFDSRMGPESPMAHNVKPYGNLLLRAREDARSGKLKLRVGLLEDSFHMPGVAADVRDIVHKAARRYFEAAGASVVEISIPLHRQGPTLWTAATRPSMSTFLCQGRPSGQLSFLPPHTQTKWPLSQEAHEALTANNPAVFNIMLSEEFAREPCNTGLEAKAHRMVFALRAAYDSALEEVDVLITPCAPTVAMPHPDPNGPEGRPAGSLARLGVAVGLTSNTCPFNVTGHPALNVPCGLSAPKERPDVSLPVGMQIIGRRWADEEVMGAAALFDCGREIYGNSMSYDN